MWKMIIMDDEAIIRRGLRNALDWESLNVEIVDEAEDGEIGIEKCKEHMPDILLVDICMPFINGLDMIKEVKSIVPNAIIFIISGYGEFDYAKEAIKLDVFDYILKPVDEDYLKNRIAKAVTLLENSKEADSLKPIDIKSQREFYISRKKVFSQILHGELLEDKENTLIKYNLNMREKFGLIIILAKKTDEYYNIQSHNEFVSHTQNIIIDDILKDFIQENDSNFIGEIDGGVVVSIHFDDISKWYKLYGQIQDSLRQKMKNCQIVIKAKVVEKDIESLSKVYDALLCEATSERKCTPIVLCAKKYIDENYASSNLSLGDVALAVDCSPSYLSKLLKKELGLSFSEYITSIRIKKAIELINTTTLRINEIADKVGYSTQHYFSTSFKKVIGISPNIYKNGEASKNE